MSFINTQAKEINCKVAYYGAPFAGKSTSLRHIYSQTSEGYRGKLVTLSEKENRALFFDFLPLSLGKVDGYKIRFHFYTIPGQIFYDNARKLILNGIDGIIFVADTQMERTEENLQSWRNLQEHLRAEGIDPRSIPLVLQLNKRDLPNALPVEELKNLLNVPELPFFETVATKGKNVMECFQSVAKQVLIDLKK